MSKIIVSLDNLSKEYALQIAENIKSHVWGFAINDLFFKYGAAIIYELKTFGKIMVDLKLYDSPKTMKNNIKTLITCGSNLISIHNNANYKANPEEAQYLAIYPTSGFNIIFYHDDLCHINYNPLYCKHILCYTKDLPFLQGHGGHDFKKICIDAKIANCKNAIKQGADLLLLGKEITHKENYLNRIKELNIQIN